MAELPLVPITLEGSSVLHQMFRFDWSGWRKLSAGERAEIGAEFAALLSSWEQGASEGHPNQSAIFSQLGHKGDLMLMHFRDSFADLNRAELALAQTRLFAYLQPAHSYLSVVELGLYESSAKTYAALAEQGFEPGTPEWAAQVKEQAARQGGAMAPRLFPAIPPAQYVCFYPMDRKRSETVNWYTESMDDRRRMMHEHGMIGRRYADVVRQIITGSIGFDDWEWGVDLFADDPVVFKKLIYEMRFDKVSAEYALFGQFFVGVRLHAAKLGTWLEGTLE
ncbi:hydrogen peroxide-dependent heme synthase [Silvibacterium dinghuense]|uniref:Heme-dependent peroxidase n=1 Tax=Silvibacterium dinghuense TaxID=1560006 RepID=A0A4Q1SH02_9BACT|nr:hydrogen peroxide-dependent heme synthase [Silvibacterium dinghuense]RXS96828.1 heme-dependent peroxidase [Silvibacterium dinghuense]GGG93982.1 putative heme-dependent peroxidase YwfI [Silvibacterium dinghuense]